MRHVMTHNSGALYGGLVLRVALGVMFIAHSAYLKLVVFTLPGTASFFESIGLPGLLAYLVFGAEVVGGILLLLGLQTRRVAAALVPILLGATWVHSRNGWLFTNSGGGWEYPLFLAAATLALALIDESAWSLDARFALSN